MRPYMCTSSDFMSNAAAVVVCGQSGVRAGPGGGAEECSLFCLAHPQDWKVVPSGQLIRPKTTKLSAVKCMIEHGYHFATGAQSEWLGHKTHRRLSLRTVCFPTAFAYRHLTLPPALCGGCNHSRDNRGERRGRLQQPLRL